MNNLRRAEEADPEAIERAGGESIGGRVRVAGEDGAGEVGAKVLDGAHGAPEHALPATAVVGVRVEEPRRGRWVGRAAAQEAQEAPEGEGEEGGDEGEKASKDRHGCDAEVWVGLREQYGLQ